MDLSPLLEPHAIFVIVAAPLAITVAVVIFLRSMAHDHDWELIIEGTSEDTYRCKACNRYRYEEHFLPSPRRPTTRL